MVRFAAMGLEEHSYGTRSRADADKSPDACSSGRALKLGFVPQSAAEQYAHVIACATVSKHKIRFQPFGDLRRTRERISSKRCKHSIPAIEDGCSICLHPRDPSTSPLSTEVSNEANDLDVNDLGNMDEVCMDDSLDRLDRLDNLLIRFTTIFWSTSSGFETALPVSRSSFGSLSEMLVARIPRLANAG